LTQELEYLNMEELSTDEKSSDVNILSPVAPDERIYALDMLRGLAMFGVLWSNLNDWYGTTDPTTSLDKGLTWIHWNLIEGRFYTLLCLLFGIGFGIQLLRATEKGMDLSMVYFRRTLILLLIGIVHGVLIWKGDILTMYALVAFSLLLFRKSSSQSILITGILLWVFYFYIVSRTEILVGWKFYTSSMQGPKIEWTLGHGTCLQIGEIRIAQYLEWYLRYGIRFYGSILATFLVGWWTIKSGYLMRVIQNPRTTRRLLLIAVVASTIGYLCDNYFSLLMPYHNVKITGITDPNFWHPRIIVRSIFGWSTEGTAIVYATVLLLLLQRSTIARLLQPLGATGRMALTTYLTQSVVCTLLFYGYGLGWYGQVGYTGNLIITLVLFSCQMAISSWWLKRFRFGPVEWLWRRLTYGHPIQMRVQ